MTFGGRKKTCICGRFQESGVQKQVGLDNICTHVSVLGADVGVPSKIGTGFILPVVFKLAPNLNLVEDDSLSVASFQRQNFLQTSQ